MKVNDKLIVTITKITQSKDGKTRITISHTEAENPVSFVWIKPIAEPNFDDTAREVLGSEYPDGETTSTNRR